MELGVENVAGFGGDKIYIDHKLKRVNTSIRMISNCNDVGHLKMGFLSVVWDEYDLQNSLILSFKT